jgi:gliding motility-associated-like protein
MKTFYAYHLRKSLYFLFALICVKADAQLHADFTSNIHQGCSPLVVQFADLSTGNPISWFWDLGNGAVSSYKNAGAIYINPGSYTVKLHIKNISGQDSIIKTDYITVYENPIAAFTATPSEGCVPFNVNFSDKSSAGSGTITGWTWDFGDGVVSNVQNPSHTYNISDTFDITLTAINSFGCKNTMQQSSFIKVDGFAKAGFNYRYNNACKAPDTVTFTNTSQSNSKLTYQWLFGDGTASTQKDPVHIYTTSGNFTVQLTAVNANGCSNVYVQEISIGSANADFDVTNGCVNERTFFTDKSSPKPLTETWEFGDGTADTGFQVAHVYTSPGEYQVTLTADFGGCTDVTRKIIKTDAKIQADFTASGKLKTCSYPQTIQFNNMTQDAGSFKWFFGDGDSSSLENPVHTYKNPGRYSVRLIAYNTYGCPDTVVKTNVIELGVPTIQGIQNLPFMGCAPQTLTLKPIILSGDLINSYQWNFGDGSFSTDSIPTHTYHDVGIYNVSLIVKTTEGCTDTLLVPGAVSLGARPKPLFSANPLNACADTTVQFKDASTGFVTDWLWLFGDGGSSSEQNPTHMYIDTGYMNVTLIVSQYGCYDTLILNKYIYIKPPIANFNFNSTCSDPFTYNFVDSSIAAKTWNWNFGDGTSSTTENIKHVYTSTGTFNVSLAVTNGNCSYTKQDSVHVIQENPAFSYESVSSNFCKYDSVLFFITQYNPDDIRSFQWDFGDGITEADAKRPETYHLYNDAGTYSPVLIVKDLNNCVDTINKNIQIKIFGPNAAFLNKGGDCLFSTINFSDESTSDGIHPIKNWIWNYGDNTRPDTLTSSPFNHTYDVPGSFDVSLKVIDDNGCYDTVTNINDITITKPVAEFSAFDTLSCSESPVDFIDSSNGVSLLYTWNFGDGQKSNSPDPSHYYSSEGTYDVQLLIKDKYGCSDSILKKQYIRVADPVVGFLLSDSIFTCPPAKINPQNTSFNYGSLIWDFGDGNISAEIAPEHFYDTAGNYDLKLTVQGYGSCYKTMEKPIIVKGPSAHIMYSPFTGCHPLEVSFSATAKHTVQYIWDFGDGSLKTSTDSNANYAYLKPGQFLPKLVVVDSAGCRVPVVNEDTVVVSGINAKFVANRHLGVCDSSRYDFTDSSITFYDSIQSYSWQFGDGDSSSEANPYHYYHRPITYNASLTVTTENGCTGHFKLPLNVLIDSTPSIFATMPDSACVNAPVSLTADVRNNSPENFKWIWNLDNGFRAYSRDTTYSFLTPGQYNLFVSATSWAGCSDTVFHITRIDPLPPVDAGLDSAVCKGQSITLNATGANTYTWLSDTSLSCSACISPVANPLFNTTYFLTGIDSHGCKASDSINIRVQQPFTVSVSADDTICLGSTVQLKATGAELYNWLPASLVKNNTDSVTSSTPQTTTTYTVIGNDRKGCFSDTASAVVNVFPYPTLQLKDTNVTIEAGNGYQINAIGSGDITLWQWTPLSGLSCTNCSEPVATPAATQTYTVDVHNIAGCSVEGHITVTVLCKGQNLFIPNTFSPNNDGMNDYFYPRGKGFSVKSFRIFSRWGTLVFERSNFQPNQQSYGWDGTYNGKAIQADVYVYVAEIVCDNGTLINSKGNITLLR